MMKKLIVALCTGVMFGSAGTALAQDHKASICHNGGTYNSDTMMEDPISFVITIAGKDVAEAVEKHVTNHEDSETYQELELGQECELLDDGITVECNEVTLCESDLDLAAF